MEKISGFTIVRNTLSQGYPFVESIISAMPVCDEFIIADGYSTDGTWEILQRLAELYPKIKLSRDKWILTKQNMKSMGILAEMKRQSKGVATSTCFTSKQTKYYTRLIMRE